jgi:hypothetical protein
MQNCIFDWPFKKWCPPCLNRFCLILFDLSIDILQTAS